MQAVFFMISSKAYSIFALMSGFIFFIQMERQQKKGIDFRGRSFWRLCIILILAFLHSLVYKSDLLHIFAILGMVLILLYKVSTRTLILIYALLILQIPMIYQLVLSFINLDYQYLKTFGEGLWEQADNTYGTGSFFDVSAFNLWSGRTTVWGWTYYNGRYLQLIALFIIGLIIGRKKIFENIGNYYFLIKILIISILIFALLGFMQQSISISTLTDIQKMLITPMVSSYVNLVFMMILLCIFILLYITYKKHYIFEYLASFGRMSLSNYSFPAIVGVFFFFGFGFGMYRYLDSSWSILIGFAVFSTQILISKIRLKHIYFGPVVRMWRALTFMDFSIKFRKKHEIELSTLFFTSLKK